MHLLDINAWLAIAVDSHEHHPLAAQWFLAAANQTCCFCRLTQLGFLRLLSTPQVMKEDVRTLAAAWQAYDDLFHDPRVVYADEPTGIEPAIRKLTQQSTFSPKVWNDAYLVAFAQVSGFEVVTFDRGFAQFANLKVTILS